MKNKNWIDANAKNALLPQAGQMAWVACPNNWLCQHQVFLAILTAMVSGATVRV